MINKIKRGKGKSEFAFNLEVFEIDGDKFCKFKGRNLKEFYIIAKEIESKFK